MAKNLYKDYPEKWDPEKETPYVDNLDHTERRKRKYKSFRKMGENIANPDITEKEHPENTTRIFLGKEKAEEWQTKPALRSYELEQEQEYTTRN
jgi:hypothetical protein